MPKFIVPNSARMRINYNVNGQLCSNVFGGLATGTGTVTQATANALRDIVDGAWNSSAIAAHTNANVGLLSVAIRNVNAADLPEFTATSAGSPGTGVGDLLPRSVCGVVTFKTAKAGKRNRGRSFYSGFTETENVNTGTPTQAALDALVAFWQAIHDNLGATGYNLAIISAALPARPAHDGSTLPAEPANSIAVDSITSRVAIWGSQRRRLHRT
jgi:hypothetical protein